MELPPPPFVPRGEALGLGQATLPTAPKRLHPLSPVVRIGRAAIALAYVAVMAVVQSRGSGGHEYVYDFVFLGVGIVAGVVSWVVTTWSVEGSSLQVSTGLIRRKAVRVPLSRVQAVDLVEPWLARLLGLAEIRVRTGGGGRGDARLQYLRVADAQRVRTALIALVHGLPGTTPEAEQRPLVRVDNRLLVLSTLVTGRIMSSVVVVSVEVLLFAVGAAVAASSLIVFVFAALGSLVKRVANEWGLAVSESPDGLRLQAGFGSRVRETIPPNRIQAVHRTEPLFWRRPGWQRLELHLAGGVARRRNQPSAVVRRALLPIGHAAEGDLLLGRLVGRTGVPMSRPPGRGRVRSPFSFHFLAAGYDEMIASSSWGRVCRRTEIVPLARVQSIRFVQGPVLRALRLATVHLDAAGRGATVSWRQWDEGEARALVEELIAACAAARELDAPRAGDRQLAGAPAVAVLISEPVSAPASESGTEPLFLPEGAPPVGK